MLIGNNFISNMHIANSSWMQKYLKPKIHRLFNKVHSRRRIYAWNPHQASPTYIKASCQNKFEIQRRLYLGIHGNRETRNVSICNQSTGKVLAISIKKTQCAQTSVVCNIHCVPVPSFPPKEFCDIHQHQYRIYKHGIRYTPIFFMLKSKNMSYKLSAIKHQNEVHIN